MENFEIVRKIIRESLESFEMDEALTKPLLESKVAIDNAAKIKSLQDEKLQLTIKLNRPNSEIPEKIN